MIRDQAQKTVDIYITRIRKYVQTMPDTALPPSSGTGSAVPRMGTPANDTSWTGWAISSFTNKLASASGDITSGANGTAAQRPSSVPPSASTLEKPTPQPSRSGMALTSTKSAASIPTVVSPDPAAGFNDDVEDFGDDWGGFNDDDAFGNTSSKANTKDEEEDPWGTPAVTAPTTTYDDKGEPDFAGWLAAQSQAKKTVKSPLPKGLAKSSAAKSTRPVVGGRSSSAGTAPKKIVVAPKKEAKKEEPKSKEDEEEGWGDAW